MATKKRNLKKPTSRAPKSAKGPATANPKAQPDPTALSIGDLKNLSTILDVASTRGAFKANEMAGVGFLYNKLQAFLAKVAPEQKPEANATAGAPTTVGTPTTVNPASAGGGK